MRLRSTIAVAVAAPLLFANCAGTVPAPSTFIPVVTAVSSLVPANIAAIAKATCGWLPMAGDVAVLISANPLVTTADGFVNMICSSVLAAKASGNLGGELPSAISINGVVVRRQVASVRYRAGNPNSVMINGVRVRQQ